MLKVAIQGFLSDQSDKELEVTIEDGEYIGVTGEKRNRLMFALIGKEDICGDIVIDETSIKENFQEYMEQVSYISKLVRKRLNGPKITTEDFMDLAVMMRMTPLDMEAYQKKKEEYLSFFEISRTKRFDDLTEEELLVLEFIVIFLKEPKLILIDDFFSLLPEEIMDKMVDFLRCYLQPDKVSVIASEKEALLKRITDRVFVLN